MFDWFQFNLKARLYIFLLLVGVLCLPLSANAAHLRVVSQKPYPPDPPPGSTVSLDGENLDARQTQPVDSKDGAREILNQTQDILYLMYLPIVFDQEKITPPSKLTGRVTYKGIAEAFTEVELVYFNGVTELTYATTDTDAQGKYQFSNLPPLSGNQYYFVRKINPSDPERLYSWYCTKIEASTTDPNLFQCDFDIENVYLIFPENDESVYFPVKFTWEKRATLADSYVFHLSDRSDGDPFNPPHFDSKPLGYEDNFNLWGTPSGFVYGKWYGWWVNVLGTNGEGTSHYYYNVKFE